MKEIKKLHSEFGKGEILKLSKKQQTDIDESRKEYEKGWFIEDKILKKEVKLWLKGR